ncbi:MAG: sugar transferase [Candidatus Acidiferrales bacterium]
MGNTEARTGPQNGRDVSHVAPVNSNGGLRRDGISSPQILSEDRFHSMLTLERRRAERSRKLFVLVLLDAYQENGSSARTLNEAVTGIANVMRETDLIGWYRQDVMAGVIFTEVGDENKGAVLETLRTKIRTTLVETLGGDRAGRIAVSLHVFPEEWDASHSGWSADSKLYPDVQSPVSGRKLSLGLKRIMDIAGSAAFLILMFPLLTIIALVIKLTSKGPVLFEQERLGMFGTRFKCLKFRTMHVNCNPRVHQDFVKDFIAGKAAEQKQDGKGPDVFKITNDPRVTPIGRFLRRTSLDELPQFWNVLRGEMSLVGPRPPLPYEFEMYDFWHRRRVLEVRPGITGLWQVNGRSRTRFDDMVRLDLRYCQTWSLMLDIKILLATPWIVISGSGAY